MGKSDQAMVDFFRDQTKLEEEIVRSVNEALKNLKNPVVVALLKGMSLDSIKHSDMYKAAEGIVSVAPAMSEEELNSLKNVLEWHIESEEKMLSQLRAAVDRTDNQKIKFLLETIAADERRHHELLNSLMDIIVKGETITDDEWWDIIWKNVPFHGGPGG